MVKLNLSKLSPELRSAARELLPQIGIQEADCGLTVESETWDKRLALTARDTVKICRQKKYQFFRGLAHI